MRIALITETFTTGVGRHIADLMGELSVRGHELHLLYGNRRFDPDLVHTVQGLPGVHLCALPMRRAPHPQDLRSLWTVWRYLRRHGPFDVLHGHSSKGGAYARLLTALLRGRCLYTPHALVTLAPDLGRPARLVYGTVERLLAPLTDGIVCCSASERAHAVALGLGERRCMVVPHGIGPFDVAPLGVREQIALPPEVLLAGFIGRLEPQKAPDLLIEAIGLLHSRGVPVHVAIAGDGQLRAALQQRLAATGAQASVSWLGAVDGRRLMTELDLLVMPSRYEGFPYVLLEALHCGVPVVATPVGGIAETNGDGRCGTVVPHDDARALADAIEQLVRDPQRRARMAEQSRIRAREFSVPAMVDRIEALYRAGPSAVPMGT
jgi:glycosyltransferase involved in cell wall biosynthesis